MSIFTSLFYWLTRPFIRAKVVMDEDLDVSGLAKQSVSYVLVTDSFTDKLAFEQATRRLGLPSPFAKLKLNNQKFRRTLGVKPIKSIFQPADAHFSRTVSLGQELLTQVELSKQDVKFVPVMICWGRAPGVAKVDAAKTNKISFSDVFSATLQTNPLRKFFIVLFSGRHNFVRVSKPVSLKQIVDSYGSSEDAAHKLLRVARIHFERQRLAATGPKIMARQAFFNSMLASPGLKKALQEEAQSKNISLEQAKKNATKLLDEIAGDYNENHIRYFDRVLTWVWNKIYNGIRVHNADQIRELAQKGHEIVYVPCHRSHMDYLLLTYVIYHQGLVPPHIAAGINLNFWPAGPIFRKAGAFFLRRTFKGNKLYSAVFREYLSQLFIKGYPVKYYTEGGRSRTGRLLQPKTGMIAMTVQSMLRGVDRPISLVPVYIGYEHVMEVNTYLKELKGKNKESESIFGIFKAIKNLKNYGHGDVNFGQPINLNELLNDQAPDWRNDIDPVEVSKPKWLTPAVNVAANEIMRTINDAAVLNTVNLCALALLTSENHALSRDEMHNVVEFYLGLQKQVPYSNNIKMPEHADEIIDEALMLEKVEAESDEYGTIIKLDEKNAILMSYYRNNVIHLYAIPSLVAGIIINRDKCSKTQIIETVDELLPLLRNELFITVNGVKSYVESLLGYFEEQNIIQVNRGKVQIVSRSSAEFSQLSLLAKIMKDTWQRYALAFNRINVVNGIARSELEKDCEKLAKRLLTLHNIKAPEYFDKKLISGFVSSLREMEYIETDTAGLMRLSEAGHKVADDVNELLSSEILQSIRSLG